MKSKFKINDKILYAGIIGVILDKAYMTHMDMYIYMVELNKIGKKIFRENELEKINE